MRKNRYTNTSQTIYRLGIAENGNNHRKKREKNSKMKLKN